MRDVIIPTDRIRVAYHPDGSYIALIRWRPEKPEDFGKEILSVHGSAAYAEVTIGGLTVRFLDELIAIANAARQDIIDRAKEEKE